MWKSNLGWHLRISFITRMRRTTLSWQHRGNPRDLVARDNVDILEVCRFSRQMAELVGLPDGIPFAQGADGPDVGVFDFTAKRSSKVSTKVLEASLGQQLLVTLVGDAAVAPFRPLGT